MSFIEGVGRDQRQLFPEVLDEYVAAENPVRFIDAFVESLNLGDLGFERAVAAETGRPGYDPRDLLSLYVYGYLYGIRSSRKLERETHRNVELMWLLRRLRPDFKTIADFRRDNGPALRKVCREFTVLCKRMDLFGAELVAIDGSKFRAVNSRARSFPRAQLEQMLGQIDARIDGYLGELDVQDGSDPSAGGASMEDLAQRIEQLRQKRTECQVLLEHLDSTGQKEVSLTDPDSRRMMTGGVTDVCYNAQIAVDEKSHLIVAEDVTNSASDRRSLAPMAQQAKEVLQVDQLAVVVDRGYTNGQQVKQCAESGIVPYMGKPQNSRNLKQGLFSKDDFTYQKATDTYRCPAGQMLTFHFEGMDKGGRRARYYWTNACGGCALRHCCTRDGRWRRIKRSPYEHFVEQMRVRVAAAPEVLRRRKAIVEHPFGTMKRWMNQGYFLTRGLQNVRAEFSLTVLAYNLKRAFSILEVPRMIAALP
jgi:transposase